ncbi:MAG: hypothetical protein NE330_19490, partial [Lentisphaeraceae bacterium]|nr:hypothetical protein [Lentisphaeraceae bacterium]
CSDLYAESMSAEKKEAREINYLIKDKKIKDFIGTVVSGKESAFTLINEGRQVCAVTDSREKLFIFNDLLKECVGEKVRLRGVVEQGTNNVAEVLSIIPFSQIKVSSSKTILSYKDAEVSKTGVRIGTAGANHFRREGISLTWYIDVATAGEYSLGISQSSAKPGAKFKVTCNSWEILGNVQKTGRLKNLKEYVLGNALLRKGENVLTFTILTMSPDDNSKAGLNLRSLYLSPVDGGVK